MKKNTQNRITQMLRLMKRNQAEFFKDKTDGLVYYTYPKGGWMKPMPEINGIPLEYVSAHDDGSIPLYKISPTPQPSAAGKPILGKIGGL